MRASAKIANVRAAVLVLAWQGFFAAAPAQAAIDNAGVMDDVLERYSAAVASWASVIISAASWLFWTLVLISMVWTFGMMALRKADIGDFFAEFVRFTVFTGFFWWLLSNGPAFANSIFDSLRQLAGDATGLGPGLSPSGIVDVGFAIFDRVLDQSTLWSPVDAAIGATLAGIILVLLALVSIKMVLLLAAGWILAFGGVFFLGFGGSRWTSGFAVNYFKTVLALAAQLMTMVLLVGIGKTFLDDYHASMRAGITLKELGVMLVVALILFMLVNWIPPQIASVITGARIGGEGGGVPATGTAPGPAPAPSGMAMTAAATGGAAIAMGGAYAAAGAQSLMAAFSGANQNMPAGSDMRYGLNSAADRDYGGAFNGRGVAAASYTPFAAAAGFSGGTPAGDQSGVGGSGDPYGWSTASGRSGGASSDGATASRGERAAETPRGIASGGRQQEGQGARTGSVASSFQRQGEAAASGAMSQSSAFDAAGFSGAGGGWSNQAGGFDALSAPDQEQARQSHVQWQSRDTESNTLGLEDYVSQQQNRRQERNDEVGDFIKRT